MTETKGVPATVEKICRAPGCANRHQLHDQYCYTHSNRKNPEPADSVVMVGDVREFLAVNITFEVMSIHGGEVKVLHRGYVETWTKEGVSACPLVRRGPGPQPAEVVHWYDGNRDWSTHCGITQIMGKDIKTAGDLRHEVTCPACLEKMAEMCPFGDYRGFCTHPDCRVHKPTEPPAVKVGQVWKHHWYGDIGWTVAKITHTDSMVSFVGNTLLIGVNRLQCEGLLVIDVEEEKRGGEFEWVGPKYTAALKEAEDRGYKRAHQSHIGRDGRPMVQDSIVRRLVAEAEARGYQRGWSEGIAQERPAWERAEKSEFQRGWQRAMDDVKDNVDRFKMNLYQDFSETEQATRAKTSETETRILPSNAHDDDFCGDA